LGGHNGAIVFNQQRATTRIQCQHIDAALLLALQASGH